jgi:leader peptidase (prepilin peptidase)/N-methyltransferase
MEVDAALRRCYAEIVMDADVLAEALGILFRSPFGMFFACLWGALWGSFFNVAIYRVGLYQSVVYPPSRCPSCGRPVRPLENVPMLSWLLLRGRCAGCKSRISPRYFVVELACTLLAGGLFWHLGLTADPIHLMARFFVEFAFVGTLVVLSGIDLDHMLIPDRITYPAIPIFFVAALLLGDTPRWELLVGPIVGYGLVAVTAELGYAVMKREVMGYGDAKLLALVGATLGWRATVFAFFAAPFVGLLVLIPLSMGRGRSLRGVEVPYGPFLAAAAVAYLFLASTLRPLWPG